MNYKEINIKGNLYKVYPSGIIESKNKILKGRNNRRDYLYVSLGKGAGGYSNYYIHRLVAQAFIPNPNNLPEVNHIDGNRQNNNYSNLEWISRKDNIRDYIEKGRANFPKRKPVLQFSLSLEFIKEWESPLVAADVFNCTKELIQQAANIKNIKCLTAKNFIWVYKKDIEYFPAAKHLKIKQ